MVTPGRVCPLSYRHGPEALRDAPEFDAGVAWVVGGLYGNVEALAALDERVADDEAAGHAPRVIFNGDFHWFDTDAAAFDRIESGVARHIGLAGNVEAELADPGREAGCGCAYPDFVDDATVERSNTIMATLQTTAGVRRDAVARLAALPRLARIRIASTTIGVVHGDPDSLAGWGLAVHSLTPNDGPTGDQRVHDWARRADVAAFACSHTCLPWIGVLGGIPVSNNGSAGMPNFRGTQFGLATRIAPTDRPAADAVVAADYGGLRFEAIPLHYDTARWWRRFSTMWPEGSAARLSYGTRIHHGPDFDIEDAVLGGAFAQRAWVCS